MPGACATWQRGESGGGDPDGEKEDGEAEGGGVSGGGPGAAGKGRADEEDGAGSGSDASAGTESEASTQGDWGCATGPPVWVGPSSSGGLHPRGQTAAARKACATGTPDAKEGQTGGGAVSEGSVDDERICAWGAAHCNAEAAAECAGKDV